jgi:paraquat-inducible protein B
MNDQPHPNTAVEDPAPPPAAVVRSRTDQKWRLSLIWAIPAVTALIGAWLVWVTLSERGPLITISFQTAEGLTANQSHVRHKDVDMGVVQKIELSPDMKRVIVTVRMNREAEPLLNDTARFWVVKPRFFAGAVSGLQTLVSGTFIELQPSGQGTEPKRDFVGLEEPPVLTSDVPGREFRLKTTRIGSISLGSPIFFRDFTVGQVLGWDLSEMAESVTIHAFVREPFTKYVHDASRFWNASGVHVQLSPAGVQLQLESLRAVLLGGIAFDTPAEGADTPVSEPFHQFTLYPDKEAADSAMYTRSAPLLTLFTGSVGGLAAGSPVTMRGLKIGEVDSVQLEYDATTDRVVAPVRFSVEPGRIRRLNLPAGENLGASLEGLVQRGLRVQLQTASLITGQKQLALILLPDAPPAQLARRDGAFVVPAAAGGSTDDVVSAAGALMGRLSAFPFEEIGRHLNQTLAGVDTLVNDGQLRQSLASLQSTLAATQRLAQNLNRGFEPVLGRLPAIATGLEDAIKRTDRLINSLDAGYGANSSLNRDTTRLLAQLSDAARSVRVLADLLSRHPEALIRGRTGQGP